MKETGGVLTVKSQLREECQVEISVNDTGPGLPLSKADQIFDAFFTTKSQGSGMGLAISKSIVESHDGRIWANNDDGRGATFSAEGQIPVGRVPTNGDVFDRVPEILPKASVAQKIPVLIFPQQFLTPIFDHRWGRSHCLGVGTRHSNQERRRQD